MRLVAIADNKRNSVLIIQITSFKTGRSVKIDFSGWVGGLANKVVASQFPLIAFTVIATGRAYDLHLFGCQAGLIDYFGYELYAVYKDVQVVGQTAIQYLAALFNDILCRLGGLARTHVDLCQMRSINFADGQMLQLLQHILLFYGSSGHVSDTGKFSCFRQ